MAQIKYRKLAHTIYHCNYHIVWTPKYRLRLLRDILADYMEDKIKTICEWKEVEVIELNVQPDHVHLVCSIPPKISVSDFMGILKGKTAIAMFKSFPSLKKKPYWGNHFWSPSYCVVSCGGASLDVVKQYIENQNTPPSERAVKTSRALSQRKD